MTRKFIDADHEAALEMRVRIGDVLPASHLARFIVGIIEQLDFSTIYVAYGDRGAPPYAPELLFGILALFLRKESEHSIEITQTESVSIEPKVAKWRNFGMIGKVLLIYE